MATKVVSQYTEDKVTVSTVITTTYGFCSKCRTQVSRSRYGVDEQCPICDSWLDWSEVGGKLK